MNAVGNQTQLYNTKHRNSPEVCLSNDSIRKKSRLWPQNASSVHNIHAMLGQRHVSSRFIPTESKFKSKLLSIMNFIIRNDNEIPVWGSATHSLSWKHYQGIATAFLLPRAGQHPTPGAHKQTAVRNCLFRAEGKQETKGIFLPTARTVLQVSETATQARDFNFFCATSVLFEARAYCSAIVLVTCRK